MRHLLPMIALAGGTLFAAQPVLAESVAVTYNDLDLSTPQGQKKLQDRIDKAAKSVCGIDDVATGTRLPATEAQACVKHTKQQIEQKFAALLEQHKAGGAPAHSPAGASPVP